MPQHELCYKLHVLKNENYDRIRELILSTHPDKCKTPDDWMKIVNELQDRVNWQHNLVAMCEHSYFNDGQNFDVKRVRLTLEDYIYNIQSIKE